MRGTRISILSLFAAALSAQTLYLPLDEGNLWVYSGPAGASAVEVGRSAVFQGNEYRAVRGLRGEGETWLRNDDEGRILMWDEAARQERVYLDAAAPEGVPRDTWADPCNRQARIETRNGKIKVPAGEFDNALVVRYLPGPCMDAGLDLDEWLPWVGLVRRVRITIAGPRESHLVYARLGGVTHIAAPETGFSLLLTPAGDRLLARMTVKHTLDWPLVLTFSSSQRFDLVVYDANGKEIYQWSRGRAFLTVMGRESIRGEKTWVAELPAADWPPGEYAVHAWITAMEGAVYSATALYRRP